MNQLCYSENVFLTLLVPRIAFAEREYRPIKDSGAQKSDFGMRRIDFRTAEP